MDSLRILIVMRESIEKQFFLYFLNKFKDLILRFLLSMLFHSFGPWEANEYCPTVDGAHNEEALS